MYLCQIKWQQAERQLNISFKAGNDLWISKLPVIKSVMNIGTNAMRAMIQNYVNDFIWLTLFISDGLVPCESVQAHINYKSNIVPTINVWWETRFVTVLWVLLQQQN